MTALKGWSSNADRDSVYQFALSFEKGGFKPKSFVCGFVPVWNPMNTMTAVATPRGAMMSLRVRHIDNTGPIKNIIASMISNDFYMPPMKAGNPIPEFLEIVLVPK